MKLRLFLVALMVLALPGCLGAGLTDALNIPTEGVMDADYKDDEQIRVVSRTSRQYENPAPIAFERIVEMVSARGYSRFALIRNKCESSTIQPAGVFAGTNCYLWAQMLEEGEEAQPKGSDDEVVYYTISATGDVSLEHGQSVD